MNFIKIKLLWKPKRKNNKMKKKDNKWKCWELGTRRRIKIKVILKRNYKKIKHKK